MNSNRRKLFAWVMAVAVVVFGSAMGYAVLLGAMSDVWDAGLPPIMLLAVPWPLALALGWWARRTILRRRA